jgi:predicted nucleic-acid-binding Zn-ribbon protein
MFGLDRLFLQSAGIERNYGPVTVLGYELRCQVCSNSEFWEHQVQLHTPAATLFNVEFANRVANCAVCARCGYVHFFLNPSMAPRPSESSDVAEEPSA